MEKHAMRLGHISELQSLLTNDRMDIIEGVWDQAWVQIFVLISSSRVILIKLSKFSELSLPCMKMVIKYLYSLFKLMSLVFFRKREMYIIKIFKKEEKYKEVLYSPQMPSFLEPF